MNVDISIGNQLEAFLNKKGRNFISLSVLREELPKDLKDKTGIKKNSKLPLVKEYLAPHLGERFVFIKGGRSTYLALNLPREELFLGVVLRSPGKTLGVISRSLPFNKTEIPSLLNQLLEKRTVRVTFNANMNPCLYPEKELVATKETSCTKQTFEAAFRELDRGEYFIRICNLRRRLNWPREIFDTMLAQLRDDEKIQMHTGDLETMTQEDIRDSYTDENGFLMLTLTWRA